jgi:uncharacterized protein YdeI (YjbR/CyaY-like superfamily)
LCVGWIDGIRKSIDAASYKIRFTPRKPTSVWSAVNIRHVEELIRQARMQPAGLRAFERRAAEKSGIYAYENRHAAALDISAERKFRSAPDAWEFFERQPASYRTRAIWWVVSAKRQETREARLQKLISLSARQQRI